MSEEQLPTEMFRDVWLPPVETVAELPPAPADERLVFVRQEQRVWVSIAGRWTPAGPSKLTPAP